MIVLDEQLLGRNLEGQIAGWYRGSVCFVTDLRPDTVIKDEAIPMLLQQQNQPTFVTINEKDFWQRVTINKRFSVVCFPIPDSRAHEIPTLLRRLFRHPMFKTKANRMGKVIRLTDQEISYYAFDNRRVHRAEF